MKRMQVPTSTRRAGVLPWGFSVLQGVAYLFSHLWRPAQPVMRKERYQMEETNILLNSFVWIYLIFLNREAKLKFVVSLS